MQISIPEYVSGTILEFELPDGTLQYLQPGPHEYESVWRDKSQFGILRVVERMRPLDIRRDPRKYDQSLRMPERWLPRTYDDPEPYEEYELRAEIHRVEGGFGSDWMLNGFPERRSISARYEDILKFGAVRRKAARYLPIPWWMQIGWQPQLALESKTRRMLRSMNLTEQEMCLFLEYAYAALTE